MEEKKLTENRVALIAALIAIPSAVLIGMLIHFFVAIPTGPLFGDQEIPIVNAVEKRPAKMMPVTPPMQRPSAQDLTDLYKEKVKLAKDILDDAEQDFKSGKKPLIDVITAKSSVLLAEGELYRYQNKIRRWGSSVSDLAVRYEMAEKNAKEMALRFKAGMIGSREAGEAKLAAADLKIQLKSHRTYSNGEWQKAYQEFQKKQNLETYLQMISAEQSARPMRRR